MPCGTGVADRVDGGSERGESADAWRRIDQEGDNQQYQACQGACSVAPVRERVPPRRLRRRASCRAAADRRRAGGRPSIPPRGRRRVGLFGGTFDPPHVGHLVTAVNVRHALELDVVVLMVANVPWQKEAQPVDHPGRSTAWRWSRRRSPTCPGLEAGRLEIDLGGPSFTADTLAALAERDARRRAVHDRRRRRRGRAGHVGAPRGGRRPLDDGRRRPARRARAPARRRRRGSASRCPASRCRAPTCGPGSATADRSTTSSPTPCCTSSPSGACTGGTA